MALAPELLSECPACGAILEQDADECPACGELLEGAVDPLRQADVDEADLETDSPNVGLREKFLFYAGIVLILLGGPGIALGSWLHDVLRISVMNYDSFDVFGAVNRLVVAVGLIVMIVGIVFFILSLRLSRPSEEDLEVQDSRDG